MYTLQSSVKPCKAMSFIPMIYSKSRNRIIEKNHWWEIKVLIMNDFYATGFGIIFKNIKNRNKNHKSKSLCFSLSFQLLCI